MEKGLKPLKEQEMDGWTDRDSQERGGIYESAPEMPPWDERQISTSPEDRHPPEEHICTQCQGPEGGTEQQFVVEKPTPDPWADLGIPGFLDRRVDPSRAPALGPPGDSLDDFK